jgi:hypothetical protein
MRRRSQTYIHDTEHRNHQQINKDLPVLSAMSSLTLNTELYFFFVRVFGKQLVFIFVFFLVTLVRRGVYGLLDGTVFYEFV